MGSSEYPRSGSYATALRRELSHRNRDYARKLALDCRESRGDTPVVCYLGSEESAQHGNFLAQSYRAILKHDVWRKRLAKPHTSAFQALPREGFRWRELDSCNSSDALLMNVFCYPAVLKSRRVCDLLGVGLGGLPEFGFRARVALTSGKLDRTEVDMRLGDLLVEAKLTESDFQSKSLRVVESYRDFFEVFEARDLPQHHGSYLSYQLIRSVLAAYASQSFFCVMLDQRRPDLLEAWYSVMSSVRLHEVRVRCKVLTWQELAETLPARVQKFLAEKYGIISPSNSRKQRVETDPEDIRSWA
jgi:Restriction Endonuclease associating with ARP